MSKNKDVTLKVNISVFDKTKAAFKVFGGRLERFQKQFKAINRASYGVERAFGRLAKTTIAPLTVATGALGYSFTSAARSFAQTADALDATAKRAGVAVGALQSLQYAASVNGTSAQVMDESLTKLNKTIYDAANGKNKDAVALFDRLGISLRDAEGNIRSASDLMPELANAFKYNTNEATRTKIAMTLFSESGTKLIPLLSQGAEGLNAMTTRAHRLGLVLSDDAVKAGSDLNNTFTELGQSLQVATGEIVKVAMPAIKELSEIFMVWLKENREMLATDLADWFKTLGNAIRSIDWGLVASIAKWAFFGKVAIEVGRFSSSLWTLGKAIKLTLAPTLIGGIARSVLSLGAGLGKVALSFIPMLVTGLATLGKAMLVFAATNPFTALITGVTLAITALYNLSDTFKSVIDKIVAFVVPDWIKNLFGGTASNLNVNENASALSSSNVGALAMSASGSVHGSVDVNVRNETTGQVDRKTAPLTGGIKVQGNPGYTYSY